MTAYMFLNLSLPHERRVEEGRGLTEMWDEMADGLDAQLAWRLRPDSDGEDLSEAQRASAIVVIVSAWEENGVASMLGRAAVPVGVK